MSFYSSLKADFKNDLKPLNDINIVINKMIVIDKDLIIEFLNKYSNCWSFIEHLSDINDKGEVEYPHYHIVVTFKSAKRFTTILNQICKFFVLNYSEFQDNHGIEVEPVIDYVKSMRYLCHLDNEDEKTPHDLNEIITTYSDKELDEIINCDSINKPRNLTVDYIRNLALRYDEINYDQFIEEIGFSRYERSRNVIRDIYKSVRLRIERENYIKNLN